MAYFLYLPRCVEPSTVNAVQGIIVVKKRVFWGVGACWHNSLVVGFFFSSCWLVGSLLLPCWIPSLACWAPLLASCWFVGFLVDILLACWIFLLACWFFLLTLLACCFCLLACWFSLLVLCWLVGLLVFLVGFPCRPVGKTCFSLLAHC